jgi:hypothetical protein
MFDALGFWENLYPQMTQMGADGRLTSSAFYLRPSADHRRGINRA